MILCKYDCGQEGIHKFKDGTYCCSNSSNSCPKVREEVLSRANNKCEYCGEKAEHCHHIRPQKLELFFSLDPDYGVACCGKCHYKYGHPTGTECSTGNLANVICKEN